MSLREMEAKIQDIRARLETLQKDLTKIDHAVNTVENPDDSALFADLFAQKTREFYKLQEEFLEVVKNYDLASKEEKNVVSFSAKKILKAVKG